MRAFLRWLLIWVIMLVLMVIISAGIYWDSFSRAFVIMTQQGMESTLTLIITILAVGFMLISFFRMLRRW